MKLASPLLGLTIVLLLVSATFFTLSHFATQGRKLVPARPKTYSAYTTFFSLPRPTVPVAYRGRDYPRVWELPPLAPVHLSHEDSVHYSIDTDLGVAEWNATLPSGGAVIHLGPDGRPFTVSMFHQLRCLDIIRDVIVDFYLDTSPDAKPKKPKLVQHCMNYLRQTVMCRGDLHLETVRAPSGPQVTVSAVTHSCKDWTVVYEAAEKNYREFLDAKPA